MPGVAKRMRMMVTTAAILAGGRSMRMGSDKAVMRMGGVMMLERAVRVARQTCPSVMVVGRECPPEEWSDVLAGVRFVADRGEAFSGPVGGVITALEEAGESVLVLGCDMPLIGAAVLRELIEAHRRAGGTWGTMAVSRGLEGEVFGEPMLAVYTHAVLPRLEEMMRTGRRSLQKLMEDPRVARWEVPATWRGELLNVNDPATLAEAEEYLKNRGGRI